MTTFSFVVPGDPVPKGRPRMTKAGRTYTPTRTVDAERIVQSAWMAAGRKTVGAETCAVKLAFLFERPASHLLTDGVSLSAVGRRSMTPGVDVDNCAKLLFDALNGLAWADDRQIVSLGVTKDWAAPGEPGETRVEFRAVSGVPF